MNKIMKIGYACINLSVGCSTNSSFILRSYSTKKVKDTIKNNLICLAKILQYNVDHKIHFFRIGSGLIPFASHPICKFNWKQYFKKDFLEIGKYIKKEGLRITMHPGQYVVLNSLDKKVVRQSIKEILYHVDVLNSFGLDHDAKVQIHVGGGYGDKEESTKRFIKVYKRLPQKIKDRLVIENDDKIYSLFDCLKINKIIGVPVVLDILHHKLNNNGESLFLAVREAGKTWKKKDGKPMIDYSTQKRGGKRGSHSQTIGLIGLNRFLKQVKSENFDLMLEVKDKNISAEKLIKNT